MNGKPEALTKQVSFTLRGRNLEYLLERFHLVRSQPVLQKRQAVAPISDMQEQIQAGNFIGMLGRLRARQGALWAQH